MIIRDKKDKTEDDRLVKCAHCGMPFYVFYNTPIQDYYFCKIECYEAGPKTAKAKGAA